MHACLLHVVASASATAWLATAMPSYQATSARPAAPQPVAAAAAAAVDLPSDFVIGAGDVLGVLFWREADVSGDVTVRPDGRITLPVIGDMTAAGLAPERLQDQIKAAATKFFTDPTVTVVVRTINSRKVFITGRVTTPGAHALLTPLTVMQALALAGGVTEYADAKNITILRVQNGQSKTFKFNYKDVARGKALEQNIQLAPGDTVVVP